MVESSDNDLISAVEKHRLVCCDFDKELLVQDLETFRRPLRPASDTADAAVSYTAKNVFQFIFKWNNTESIRKLCLILPYFLIIYVSVPLRTNLFQNLNQ